MSFLSKVQTKPQPQGAITLLLGPNGVGKSSVVALATLAKPLLIDLEEGGSYLTVPRVTGIKSLKDFQQTLQELVRDPHDYTLVGIDTMDVLEALIFDDIIREGKVKSIEDYGGGFGKGYVRSREVMREIMESLRAISNKGIDVFLISHTQVKPHKDPTEPAEYHRYVPRMNDKMASIVKDLSDNIFFASYKTYVTEGEFGKRTTAVGGDERVMYTEWRAGHDGKNRQSLDFQLPLSYDAYKAQALRNFAPGAEDLEKSIAGMIPAIKDAAIQAKVQAQLNDAKGDIERLVKIKARLQVITTKQ